MTSDFQLPPLNDIDSNETKILSRSKTAPPTNSDLIMSNLLGDRQLISTQEAMVRGILAKAKKMKGITSSKTSETEKRLLTR